MLVKIEPETILFFKNNIENSNSELNQLFESINSSFISSSNKTDKFKHIKIIKNIKKSNNKWKTELNLAKKDNNMTILVKVKNILNKITDDNFDSISDELISIIKINNYNELLIFSNEIFNRIIVNPIYIDVYIKLIIKVFLITENEWMFNENNILTVLVNNTQRKFLNDFNQDNYDNFINLLDKDFINNINDITFDGLEEKEVNIKKKSMALSNIKLIVKLHQNNIICDNIINEIINVLTASNNKSSIEALIEILDMQTEKYDIYLNNKNKFESILDNNDYDFRLKFIYEEAFKKYFSNYKFFKKYKMKERKIINNSIFEIESNNILDEYIELGQNIEVIEYLNTLECGITKFINILLTKILCSKNDCYKKLEKLFLNLYKKKYFKRSDIKKEIKYIFKSLKDISIDYPIANKNLKNILNFIGKNKMIDIEFINKSLHMISN